MRYHALATDYDGTIAHQGRVDPETRLALGRVRAFGRIVVLVTGRELADLSRACPDLGIFDRIVAENGASLFHPETGDERPLAPPPDARFVAELRARGISPLGVGRTIVATDCGRAPAVMEVIRDLGLELQIVFNKASAMILPSGINKATGLAAALESLGLSAHNVVGVGDAENDHAFLAACECGVAVADAVESLKTCADLTTVGGAGAGVVELIERLIATDLAELAPRLTRHDVRIGGRDGDGLEFRVQSENLLLVGAADGGMLATTIVGRIAERGYQVAIVDAHGRFEGFDRAAKVGEPRAEPSIHRALALLRRPSENAVIDFRGVRDDDRRRYFAELVPHIEELRRRNGHPHALFVDEADHLLATTDGTSALVESGLILMTDRPGNVSPTVLSEIDMVIASGATPVRFLDEFCRASGRSRPEIAERVGDGEALGWRVADRRGVFRFLL